MMRAARAVLALLVVLLAVSPGGSQTTSSRRATRDLPVYQKKHGDLHERFAKGIEDLAKEVEEKSPEEAGRLRELALVVETARIRFAPLPRKVRPDLPADIPAADRFRESQVRKHQADFARELYLLSRQALHAGHVSYAYDLVRETAYHDTDHASARKILGYERLGEEWLSPFEADMKRKNRVWHPQFGWLLERDVPRYEKGERLFGANRWIPAAKDAELRRDFRYAWEIRTEHFLVKTNHGLERGVELASSLERFYGLCRQSLAGFFFNPDQLRLLFDGKGDSRQWKIKPLEVHYYRTRDEYVKVLKKMTDQPVEITKGMYFPSTNVAYFFHDPDDGNVSTLYHEATHLLLSGSRPQAGVVGQKRNFWLVEGIACYMESFRADGEQLSVGDSTHDRVRAAQHHLVHDNYFVPLREFAGMGIQAFQTDKEIRKNYSQAAALTHFFLHFDNGRYRDALVEHLSQIYSSQVKLRLDPQSLSELTGTAEEELDREYAEYLKALDTRAAAERPQATGDGP